MELTAEGRDLLPWIRDLAASEHRLRERVDDLKNLDAGEIRVLVFYSISLRWIPGILERFHRDYPNIRVQLVSVDETGLAQEMTRRREVDCGFYILPVADDLEMIPVMDEPMKASFAPDHPAAAMDHFPVADLDKYPYINLVRDTEVMDLFRKYGKTPKIGFTSENDLSALAMASKGLGYCINSSILLEDIPGVPTGTVLTTHGETITVVEEVIAKGVLTVHIVREGGLVPELHLGIGPYQPRVTMHIGEACTKGMRQFQGIRDRRHRGIGLGHRGIRGDDLTGGISTQLMSQTIGQS